LVRGAAPNTSRRRESARHFEQDSRRNSPGLRSATSQWESRQARQVLFLTVCETNGGHCDLGSSPQGYAGRSKVFTSRLIRDRRRDNSRDRTLRGLEPPRQRDGKPARRTRPPEDGPWIARRPAFVVLRKDPIHGSRNTSRLARAGPRRFLESRRSVRDPGRDGGEESSQGATLPEERRPFMGWPTIPERPTSERERSWNGLHPYEGLR
jgi:hypothetical protein